MPEGKLPDPEMTLADVAQRLRLAERTLRRFLKKINFQAIQATIHCRGLSRNQRGTTKMPLTLVKPRPGKTPNWAMRGTIRTGHKTRYINETTGVADRKLAEQIRARREAQILDELIHGVKPRHLFEEAAVGYAATLAPHATQRLYVIGRLRRDGSVSPCLVSDFAGCYVDEINQEAVDAVILKRFAGRKSGSVVRGLISPLTSVLNWAGKRDWCKRPAFDRPKFNDRRKRWANYEEVERLVAGASPHLRPLLLFLILTGCRIGEALSLDWEDVDLNARWLVFRNTKRNKAGLDVMGEDRGAPIHPQLVLVLANLPVGRDGRQGRVFRTAGGQPYADREAYPSGGQIKTAWRGACRRAGITGLRTHDLRHTCATWLLMAGVQEEVRDEIIGHKSTSTGRRYAHVPRGPLLAAIDRLAWIGGKSAEATTREENLA
jgi:integrase